MRKFVFIRLASVAALTATVLAGTASAANFTVSTNADSGLGSLRQAITDSNAAGGTNTITLNAGLATITLAADLPVVQASVTILGNYNTLDGAESFRGFLVAAWTAGTATMIPVSATIQDLTIQNAKASGGSGGGGGAGLGAGVFVGNLASVTLSYVAFSGNSATGGNGRSADTGGGGMGANGERLGGGGLGVFANGAVSSTSPSMSGSPGIATGAASGGAGAGPSTGVGGANGGGGGYGNEDGGGGGVGGGDGISLSLSATPSGGTGGFGGGGGGANIAGLQQGSSFDGFLPTASVSGGSGGFGGGGGDSTGGSGALNASIYAGGAGGFGGGGGGTSIGGTPGTGGFGGGNGGAGTSSGGGGGGGMGGALFVQQGGVLILNGPLTVNGSTVAAGVGTEFGSPGSAFGAGLFIQGNGTVTFSPGTGQIQTFSDEIADQTGNGGTGGNAGVGVVIKNGAGTLYLLGVNTYTGATSINDGTLLVNGSLAAASAVTIASGATLGGAGTVNGSVTDSAGGLIALGSSIGTLSVGGSFTWNGSTDGSAMMQFKLSNTGSTSDQLAITRTLTKGTAGTFKFDFQGLGHVGATYTVATFASTNFSVADFSYTNLGLGLTGSFAIVGGTQLQFKVNPGLFTANPASVTIASGRSAAFNVTILGAPTSTYQWTFNGASISGATDAILLISGATSANAGTYACTATNSGGLVTSTSATLTVASVSNPAFLDALSARANIGTGNNILIGGITIRGSGNKQLILRGVGPALGSGVGIITNPVLALEDANGLGVAINTGWGNVSVQRVPPPSSVSIGMATSALQLSNIGSTLANGSADSAMLVTLPVGQLADYTAEVSGGAGGTGIGMVEIYNADTGTSTGRINSLSARANVGTGNNILIGGFVIQGAGSETVMVRGIGPALNSASALAQPVLTVFDSGGTALYSNTVWGGDATVANVIANTVGPPGLNAASQDSVLLVSLPPGNYTAQVSGLNSSTGLALIEVYEVY